MMNTLLAAIERPVPTIAGVFTDTEDSEAMMEVIKRGGVAEYRADLVTNQEPSQVVDQLKQFGDLPVFMTVRILPEGGQWKGNTGKRLDLFEAALPYIDGVDIELRSKLMKRVTKLAINAGRLVIASRHNFKTVPTMRDLNTLLAMSEYEGANYLKVAATPNDQQDYTTLRNFAEHHYANTIVVAMDSPNASRRFRLRSIREFPSKLVYASAGSTPLVYGQLTVSKLHKYLLMRNPSYAQVFY